MFAYAIIDGMGRESLQQGPVGERVAAILTDALDSSDMSLRQLAARSGVKLTRLGDVLRRGRPITAAELNDVAGALGLVGWQVMRDAEMDSVTARPPFAPAPEGDRWWEGEDVAALDPGYSPRMEEDQPDPDPDDWGA